MEIKAQSTDTVLFYFQVKSPHFVVIHLLTYTKKNIATITTSTFLTKKASVGRVPRDATCCSFRDWEKKVGDEIRFFFLPAQQPHPYIYTQRGVGQPPTEKGKCMCVRFRYFASGKGRKIPSLYLDMYVCICIYTINPTLSCRWSGTVECEAVALSTFFNYQIEEKLSPIVRI